MTKQSYVPTKITEKQELRVSREVGLKREVQERSRFMEKGKKRNHVSPERGGKEKKGSWFLTVVFHSLSCSSLLCFLSLNSMRCFLTIKFPFFVSLSGVSVY